MYAVIKTGGKQYRVAPNDILEIERLHTAEDAGEEARRTLIGDNGTIEFVDVLMVGGVGMTTTIGAPFIAGAKVVAELVEHTRGPKVIAFKKRRRKNSRRKRGHRQDLTKIKITSIIGA